MSNAQGLALVFTRPDCDFVFHDESHIPNAFEMNAMQCNILRRPLFDDLFAKRVVVLDWPGLSFHGLDRWMNQWKGIKVRE